MSDLPKRPEAVVGPKTPEEWTVHALNLHGVFFQRWCEWVIRESKVWQVAATEYPVEFPPPNGPFRGKESRVDIRVQLDVGALRVTLIVECKKHNPDFVDWVFFRKRPISTPSTVYFSQVVNRPEATGWRADGLVHSVTASTPVCDEGIETRGRYGEKDDKKTKTSTTQIQDAGYQVVLGAQAVGTEEVGFSSALGRRPNALSEWPRQWERQVVVPVVVTTANLLVCDFSPEHVKGRNGELGLRDSSLVSVPKLYYEVPIPKHLQGFPSDLGGALGAGLLDLFVRKHILVVHSEHLDTALKEMVADLSRVTASG